MEVRREQVAFKRLMRKFDVLFGKVGCQCAIGTNLSSLFPPRFFIDAATVRVVLWTLKAVRSFQAGLMRKETLADVSIGAFPANSMCSVPHPTLLLSLYDSLCRV